MDVNLTALWEIMADRPTDWPTDRPVHREVSLPIMLIYLLFVMNDLKNKLFHINFPGTKCWSRWRPQTRRPSPSLPLLHLNLPPPLVVVAACHWHPLSADRIKLSLPLLDLTNKSPEPPTAAPAGMTTWPRPPLPSSALKTISTCSRWRRSRWWKQSRLTGTFFQHF